MDTSAVAERYFEAWNRRDPEAVAAVFADDGTYADPNVPGGLGPEETAATPAASSPRSRTWRSRSRARASARTARSPPSGS
jgi:hypothetical protein